MGLSSKQVSSDHLDHFNWTQNMLTSSAAADTSITIQPPSTTSNHRSMKRPLQQSADLAAAANLKCPRCDSTNTKFCYYNNYNKTQPRHFCKACKRHWTKGGTLRNVPVGGARKNNRRIIKQRPNNNNNNNKSLGTFGDHQKYIFPDDKGLFFKPNDSHEFDQVSWDFNGITTTMQHESPHQNLGFSVHQNSLTSIDHHANPNIPMMMIPTSFAPLLPSDLIKDDSTVTTTTTTRSMISMIPNSSSSNVSQFAYMQQEIPTTSNFLEPSYWTTCWNDIDSMVQADLNKPFEDTNLN